MSKSSWRKKPIIWRRKNWSPMLERWYQDELWFAQNHWDAEPIIKRLKMYDLICRAKPYLEKSFNGGKQIKTWYGCYFSRAYEDLFKSGWIIWKDAIWDFDALRQFYLDKVPTLERFEELPLWQEIPQSEQEWLTDFFQARPLFLKKRINKFYRRFIFPEEITSLED